MSGPVLALRATSVRAMLLGVVQASEPRCVDLEGALMDPERCRFEVFFDEKLRIPAVVEVLLTSPATAGWRAFMDVSVKWFTGRTPARRSKPSEPATFAQGPGSVKPSRRHGERPQRSTLATH